MVPDVPVVPVEVVAVLLLRVARPVDEERVDVTLADEVADDRREDDEDDDLEEDDDDDDDEEDDDEDDDDDDEEERLVVDKPVEVLLDVIRELEDELRLPVEEGPPAADTLPTADVPSEVLAWQLPLRG